MAKHGGKFKGLYEKRGWYYYRPPTPKGGGIRPQAVALGTRDLVSALLAMQEIGSEVTAKLDGLAGTMDEVLPRYLAAKAGDAKPTRRVRKLVLEAFRDANHNPVMKAVDLEMIQRWRSNLAEVGGRGGMPVGLATLRSYTIVLRAFLKWAVEMKVIAKHPLPKMERTMRVGVTRLESFLTEDQRDRVLAADCEDYLGLVLRLGFFAGMRDGEMLALNPSWIWISPDRSYGTITVRPTPILFEGGKPGVWYPKNRKSRQIPLHPRLLEFLEEYKMRSPWMIMPEKQEWPGDAKTSKRFDCKKALHGVAKRAGVKKLTFHMLRHTFATHLAMKGVALAEIAGMLGDTLSVTEKHYAGFCPNKVNPLSVL